MSEAGTRAGRIDPALRQGAVQGNLALPERGINELLARDCLRTRLDREFTRTSVPSGA